MKWYLIYGSLTIREGSKKFMLDLKNNVRHYAECDDYKVVSDQYFKELSWDF